MKGHIHFVVSYTSIIFILVHSSSCGGLQIHYKIMIESKGRFVFRLVFSDKLFINLETIKYFPY